MAKPFLVDPAFSRKERLFWLGYALLTGGALAGLLGWWLGAPIWALPFIIWFGAITIIG